MNRRNAACRIAVFGTGQHFCAGLLQPSAAVQGAETGQCSDPGTCGGAHGTPLTSLCVQAAQRCCQLSAQREPSRSTGARLQAATTQASQQVAEQPVAAPAAPARTSPAEASGWLCSLDAALTVSELAVCVQLAAQRAAATSWLQQEAAEAWVDRYGNEPRKGADVLVQCLEREGANRVFAYPGGASLEIHQALTRSGSIRNTLCRHEQVRASSLCAG